MMMKPCRPDVQLVRLPLITYEWWRRMQLHHFTALASTNTSSSESSSSAGRAGGKAKKSKAPKGPKLGRDGWFFYGSASADENDAEVARMERLYQAPGPHWGQRSAPRARARRA